MWLAPIFPVLALTMPGAGLEASSAQAGTLPALQATRQTQFSIPFRADTGVSGPNRPVEVQLYVSADRGASWRLAAKADPHQRQFLFQAGGEGEYWFLVRTRDASGLLRPASPPQPELRVLVDTTQPQMALDAGRRGAGQATLVWRINEPYLDPDSLRIHYQLSPDPAWHPVVIDARTARFSGATYCGEVSWALRNASGRVQVRAEVADRAGNRSIAHAQIDADPAAGRTASPAGPDRSGWYAVDRQAERRGSYHDSLAGDPGDRPSPAARVRPVGGRVYPPVGAQYRRTEQAADRFAAWGLPPGERPRIINNRLFELEYDDQHVIATGVDRVELWGTRDNGRTWQSYALDNDTRSPLLVKLDDEGLYGFRVVMQNAAGQGDRPPVDGDVPELWVGLDLTQPEARIISARQGTGAQTGQMTITWTARDWLLAAQPVSLHWSDHASGPWTPIVEDITDTGSYTWRLDTRGPEQIYLRLIVRDEAGNVATDVTPKPVLIDRLLSSERIRDVRPVTYTTIRPLPRRLR